MLRSRASRGDSEYHAVVLYSIALHVARGPFPLRTHRDLLAEVLSADR